MDSKPTFVAAVIAGSEVDRPGWEAMIDSLKGKVDHVALSWNGQGRKPPKWVEKSEIDLTWGKLAWDDDFSAQRTRSFEIAKLAYDPDWIVWIDTDDVWMGASPAEVVAACDPMSTGVFLRYAYAHDPVTGLCVVSHWRERILSTRQEWVWVHRYHESALAPPGTQFATSDAAYIKHTRNPSSQVDDRGRRERNRRLMALERKERPNDPRLERQFADEVMIDAHAAMGPDRNELLIAAAHAYAKVVELDPQSDDGYTANHRMADALRDAGEPDRAIQADLQGIRLRPTLPDSYNGLAMSYLRKADPLRAESFATMCLAVTKRDEETMQAIEEMEVIYMPLLLRGEARTQLLKLEDAREDLNQAYITWPNEELAAKISKLDEFMAAAPHESAVVDLKTERRARRGTGARSIAFFTNPLYEPWHPAIEADKGAGGAETCVMRLAPRFAEDGWRVAVYGTPGLHEGVGDDGIEWWKSEDFVAAEPFDVVVASRNAAIYEGKVNAPVRIVWHHDVNMGQGLLPGQSNGDRVRNNVTAHVALTRWHRDHLHRLYGIGGKTAVLPNGIETQLFPELGPAVTAPRFVYSSSPDRGLENLLNGWPVIKSIWPDATLEIFYGWDGIMKIIERFPNTGMAMALQHLRNKILDIWVALGAEDSGITWRGRVPQAELAKELTKASCWLYPTAFMETFCITALETQMAGVIPVTSRLAALNETVRHLDYSVEGWPANSDYQKRWIKKLELAMAHLANGEAEELRQTARWHAESFSWDEVYSGWRDMLDEMRSEAVA